MLIEYSAQWSAPLFLLDVYCALTFAGGLLRTYTLNTEVTPGGNQASWLETDLAQATVDCITWKIVQYHRDIRPHISTKAEQNDQYDAWAGPFYTYGVNLVVECDAHTVERTWSIKPTYDPGHDEGFIRDDVNGTVYVGEGTWGAPLRLDDDTKDWTRDSEMFNQFKWIFVDTDRIELRTIRYDNVDDVGQVSDADPFSPPPGLDIWSPPNGAVLTIVPAGGNYPPIAGFNASPSSGAAPLEVSFDASTSYDIDGSIVNYSWDFGGGEPVGSGISVTHTYATHGEYTVTLTVTDDGGEIGEVFSRIEVADPLGPTPVSFQDGVNGYNGTRDTILKVDNPDANYGIADQLEVDGSPDYATLISWDVSAIPVGSTIQSAEIDLHVFNLSSSGYYVYELNQGWAEMEATWNEYRSGSAWQTPGAQGSMDRAATPIDTINASATGHYAFPLNSAGIDLVQDWVDDPSSNHGIIIQRYSGATDGIDLYSRETKSISSRRKLSIMVEGPYNEPPIASFTADAVIGDAPLEVAFDASASDDPDGTIVSYNWDFGDMEAGSGATSSHTYTSAGAYNVVLRVTDDRGWSGTSSLAVRVLEPNQTLVVLQQGKDGYSGNRDTGIRSDAADTNFGDGVEIKFDGDPDRAMLVAWDLSAIPPGSAVDGVEFRLTVSDASPSTYSFHQLLRPWLESEATWNQFSTDQPWSVPGVGAPIDMDATQLGAFSAPTTERYAGVFNADGRAVVQQWIDAPATNHGIILRSYSPTNGVDVASSENVTPEVRPSLHVLYSSGLLAIDLISFNARILENSVELVWVTRSESDKTGFDQIRSLLKRRCTLPCVIRNMCASTCTMPEAAM